MRINNSENMAASEWKIQVDKYKYLGCMLRTGGAKWRLKEELPWLRSCYYEIEPNL